jgi:hypothetical protein
MGLCDWFLDSNKETLSPIKVLGDWLSMYKLKSTIPGHVAPIEIFVVS